MARTLDRRPDASLRRQGTTLRATVDRIVRTFDRATASDLEAGARWYADGGAVVDDVAHAAGVSREHAAAVVSHLSPRTTWGRNVAGAMALA